MRSRLSANRDNTAPKLETDDFSKSFDLSCEVAATTSYRGAILNGFREVEDALSDLGTLALQGEAVDRALVLARDTTLLTKERYQQGLTTYLDFVDA